MTFSNEPRTDAIAVAEPPHRGGIAKWVRTLALPIIIGWVVVIGFLNVSVPQLEEVGQMRSVSMSPSNAPSVNVSTSARAGSRKGGTTM